MGLHKALPNDIKEVDVIIAGGKTINVLICIGSAYLVAGTLTLHYRRYRWLRYRVPAF